MTRKRYPETDAHGRKRTPWAIICKDDPYCGVSHGLVYLTKDEYMRQLSAPDALWKCPICKCSAHWDDDNYEDMAS